MDMCGASGGDLLRASAVDTLDPTTRWEGCIDKSLSTLDSVEHVTRANEH